eukprot:2184682-Rhodomonas_salina.1
MQKMKKTAREVALIKSFPRQIAAKEHQQLAVLNAAENRNHCALSLPQSTVTVEGPIALTS